MPHPNLQRCQALLLLLLVFFPFSLSGALPKDGPQREFRGVWVATVHNIDWPSAQGLSVAKQQAEFRQILDAYQALNFNSILVQVRTAGDVLYPSALEPWSRVLSGQEGKAPAEGFDPLAFMIGECHARGLDFHAWINPFRATVNLETASLAPNHAYRQHHDWMVRYGSKYYFNPGIPAVREHVKAVVKEILTGYDVDGIHLDDYFYPYPEEGEVFKDLSTFVEYGNGFERREDWRRANIDSLVAGLSQLVRETKPWVQFGVSPFGVWRNQDDDPRGSNTRADNRSYDDLYADPLLWMRQGWVDYLIPQVYWSQDFHLASYKTLINWWSRQKQDARLYVGQGLYKVRNDPDRAWSEPGEVPGQIRYLRRKPEFEGTAFFSAQSLLKRNQKLYDALQQFYFDDIVLAPTNPRVASEVIEIPRLKLLSAANGTLTIEVSTTGSEEYRYLLTHFHNSAFVSLTPGIHEKLPLTQDGILTVRLPDTSAAHLWLSVSLQDRYGRQTLLSSALQLY